MSTLFFVLQTAFTLFAGDIDADGDTDFDSDFDADGDHGGGITPFGFFTIRNMIGFFLGFSWAGIACVERGVSKPWTIAIAITAGLFMVAVIMLLMQLLFSMKSSGTALLANAVGKEGTVQIAVPEGKEGRGKVNVVLQGRMMELEAVTEGERLEKGQLVKITGVIGNQALQVEKI